MEWITIRELTKEGSEVLLDPGEGLSDLLISSPLKGPMLIGTRNRQTEPIYMSAV